MPQPRIVRTCNRNQTTKLNREYHTICDPIWTGSCPSINAYNNCFIKRFNITIKCFDKRFDGAHVGALKKVLKNREKCYLSKHSVSSVGLMSKINTRNTKFINKMIQKGGYVTMKDLKNFGFFYKPNKRGRNTKLVNEQHKNSLWHMFLSKGRTSLPTIFGSTKKTNKRGRNIKLVNEQHAKQFQTKTKNIKRSRNTARILQQETLLN